MAASICAGCGAGNAPGSAYCQRCGRQLPSATAAAPSGATTGSAVPSGPPSVAPAPAGPTLIGYVQTYPGVPPSPVWNLSAPEPVASPSEDAPALRDVTWGGVLMLIAFLVYYAVPLAIGTALLPSAGRTGFSLSTARLWEFSGADVAAGALLIVGLVFQYRAFRGLRGRDARFGAPATLALLVAIAMLAVVPLNVAETYTGVAMSNCLAGLGSSSAGNPALGPCAGAAGIVDAVEIGLVVVGILAIVGYLGTAVGVYRLGTRNNSGLLQAGGILLCIPILNVGGAILVFAGAHAARQRLQDPPTVPAITFVS